MEAIVERIAVWIEETINDVKDVDQTMSLNAVRPKILDWQVEDFKHDDVIIEIIDKGTLEKTSTSRKELAEWRLYGIIKELPDDTAADTQLCRMTETIRQFLLNENKKGQACGGLALSIDCPEDNFSGDILYGTS